MLKGITINTPPEAEPHIYAEDDAAIFQSFLGTLDGVFNYRGNFAATVLSNNKVRIADGVACVGGHMCRQPYAEYEDLEIANGQTGQNRNDIIVIRFVTTGNGGEDTFSFEVKRGVPGTMATDPALTMEDLYAGGKIRELPLYRVKIEGLSIVKIEKMYDFIVRALDVDAAIADLEGAFNLLNAALSTVTRWTPELQTANGRIVNQKRGYNMGEYVKFGKLVFVNIQIKSQIMESGEYARVSLPFPPSANDYGTCFIVGECYNLTENQIVGAQLNWDAKQIALQCDMGQRNDFWKKSSVDFETAEDFGYLKLSGWYFAD